eukprot:6184372-Pleurochrysis_carterae.AAC.2
MANPHSKLWRPASLSSFTDACQMTAFYATARVTVLRARLVRPKRGRFTARDRSAARDWRHDSWFRVAWYGHNSKMQDRRLRATSYAMTYHVTNNLWFAPRSRTKQNYIYKVYNNISILCFSNKLDYSYDYKDGVLSNLTRTFCELETSSTVYQQLQESLSTDMRKAKIRQPQAGLNGTGGVYTRYSLYFQWLKKSKRCECEAEGRAFWPSMSYDLPLNALLLLDVTASCIYTGLAYHGNTQSLSTNATQHDDSHASSQRPYSDTRAIERVY